jgi:hypothetical protein
MTAQTRSLSLESLGHLNYLHSILTQPTGEWEGFYHAQSPSMNFALRYQLAFATYALALMSTRTPAYRKPYIDAMRAGIEKMLHADVWGYWRAPEGQSTGNPATSGHVAVLAGPHQRVAVGAPSDPIARDNLQYSGHLSTMLGLYEKLSGDSRYDEPFTLRDEESGATYSYTHSQVAARIHDQMRQNRFGGVCCEPGMAYVPCNNYAMASNILHDTLHGTNLGEANAGWLETVRRKMVLHGPAARGVFGTAYMKDLRLATPVAFNFTDAWGLAFLQPFDKELASKLYRKFRRKVERERDEAYVGSSQLSERMEISDVAVNTGFGAILARGVGDKKMAGAMERYARRAFGAGWDGSRYFYTDAPRTLHATALYAFAGALDVGGENFARLFTGPPVNSGDKPYLAGIVEPSGRVGVCRAEHDESGALRIGLRQVGAPGELAPASPVEARLRVEGVGAKVRVEIGGRPYEGETMPDEDGVLSFGVEVVPSEVKNVSVVSGEL